MIKYLIKCIIDMSGVLSRYVPFHVTSEASDYKLVTERGTRYPKVIHFADSLILLLIITITILAYDSYSISDY